MCAQETEQWNGLQRSVNILGVFIYVTGKCIGEVEKSVSLHRFKDGRAIVRRLDPSNVSNCPTQFCIRKKELKDGKILLVAGEKICNLWLMSYKLKSHISLQLKPDPCRAKSDLDWAMSWTGCSWAVSHFIFQIISKYLIICRRCDIRILLLCAPCENDCAKLYTDMIPNISVFLLIYP